MEADEKKPDKPSPAENNPNQSAVEPDAASKSQPQTVTPPETQVKPGEAVNAVTLPSVPEPQAVKPALTVAAMPAKPVPAAIQPAAEKPAVTTPLIQAQAKAEPQTIEDKTAAPTHQIARAQGGQKPAVPPDFAVVVAAAPVFAGPEQPHRSNEDTELYADEEAERIIRGKSRRSFLWGIAAVAGAWGGLEWLGTRRTDKGVAWPFRRLLEVNENLSRDLFSSARLAPEYSKGAAKMPRANGQYGVATEENPDWQLRLVGLADMSAAQMPDTAEEANTSSDAQDSPAPAPADKKGGAKPVEHDKKGGAKPPVAPSQDTSDESDSSNSAPVDKEPAVLVTMKEIHALPRTEIVTELKCIEGWSTIVHWVGCRLVDFMQKYPPATKSGRPFDPKRLDDLPEYVSMETPDGAYYVGLDMASALHPQTLLCYEMNGKPLELEHGAPLRLAIPVKYGIKNIKNIGKIKFTDERPKDYWGELGYDWYAGH